MNAYTQDSLQRANAIHLATDVPGPRSRAIMARREAVIPRGVSHAMPVVVSSASVRA